MKIKLSDGRLKGQTVDIPAHKLEDGRVFEFVDHYPRSSEDSVTTHLYRCTESETTRNGITFTSSFSFSHIEQ